MEGVKGSIFIFVVALLVLIPYGMRRHDLVATHLAPLNGFVFGLQEVPYEAGIPVSGAVKSPPVLACDTSHGSVISAHAYPSVWQDHGGKGDTREYVNRRDGISVSCPAGWVEKRPLLDPRQVLRVGPFGEDAYPVLEMTVLPLSLYSLQQSPTVLASLIGDNVRTLNEKSSQLKEGASAYEAEFEWMKDGRQVTTMMLATLKGRTLIMAYLSHASGQSDEETKKILYSLTTELGGE